MTKVVTPGLMVEAGVSSTAPSAVVKAPPTDAEPAGAARFAAVSYPNEPVKTPDPVYSLEQRVAALESVVHALVPGVGDKHGVIVGWLEKVGSKIKADVAKVL
jgi:hypothetical protein